MKLVDLLARELESWPDKYDTLAISQDGNGGLNRLDSGVFPENAAPVPRTWESWPSRTWTAFSDISVSETASDWRGAIVTKPQWQSARDKLKGESAMPKADKGGWIRHRGGKCPVEFGTVVECRLRNGQVPTQAEANFWTWTHGKSCPKDRHVMAYRIISLPPIHDELESDACEYCGEMPAAKYFDGPLQWRDRIKEIDFDKAAAQQAHDAAMAALDSERAELVDKLKAEGFALISEPIKAEDSAQWEDMSDPRKWKKGDLIEAIKECDGQFTIGSLYTVKKDYEPIEYSVKIKRDDCGSKENGWGPSNFKWHSRPSKP